MASFILQHGRSRGLYSLQNILQGRLHSIPKCCQHTTQRQLSYQRGRSASTGVLSQNLWQHQSFRPNHMVYSIASVRWNSTAGQAAQDLKTTLAEGYIPEPPPIPVPPVADPALPVVDLNALGEPTLSSLGLCNYTPPGLVQWALETLHVSADLPWWGAIMIGTITIRCLIFPLVIKSQRNSAMMHNHMPTIQRLQERFTQSRMSGNVLEAARAGHELQDYMKRNNVSPMKNMLMPMVQAPIFISVFVGLRKMANLPLDSMRTGGLLWFTDLTVPDPFYILPLLTASTFLATVELGVDGVRAENMSHGMRWFMRCLPLIMFPVILNFPAAMLCYWMTSNMFSLCQVALLKIPSVRTYFNIPDLTRHNTMDKPKKKKFIQGFKENWSNSKMLAEVEDRQRVEATKFKDAGTGPLVKTYSYDPTKGNPKVAARKK